MPLPGCTRFLGATKSWRNFAWPPHPQQPGQQHGASSDRQRSGSWHSGPQILGGRSRILAVKAATNQRRPETDLRARCRVLQILLWHRLRQNSQVPSALLRWRLPRLLTIPTYVRYVSTYWYHIRCDPVVLICSVTMTAPTNALFARHVLIVLASVLRYHATFRLGFLHPFSFQTR